MARIEIPPGSVSKDDIRTLLRRLLPQFEIIPLGRHTVIKRSFFVGVRVVVQPDAVRTRGVLPSYFAVFVALVVAVMTGFLVPYIVYVAAIGPEQKALSRHVGHALRHALTGGTAHPGPGAEQTTSTPEARPVLGGNKAD